MSGYPRSEPGIPRNPEPSTAASLHRARRRVSQAATRRGSALASSIDLLLLNEREHATLGEVACPLVVVKRGAGGAAAYTAEGEVRVPGHAVDVVDTTGAGDSFDAGFLHRFIHGADIQECLRLGNLAGALSATRSGGTEAFRDAAHRDAFLAQ